MLKTRYLIAAFSFIFIVNETKAQEVNFSRNSIYLEIFGNGGIYSINYERNFNGSIAGRIGFATFSSDLYGYNTRITNVPLSVSCITGKNKSHFEAGGGVLLGVKTEYDVSNTLVDLIGFIGYRYQPAGKGFLFRIGLTPFYSLDGNVNYPDSGFTLSGGVSLGYHF